MNSQKYERAREIFLEARTRTPDERESFVSRATGNDREIFNLVTELLDADDSESQFLDQPALGDDFNIADSTALNGTSDESDSSADRHPDMIGSYEITRLIGKGGMGYVYQARQSNPRRDVAIKVIRSGLESDDAIRRFRHEAQVLGRLHHPGIAKIFEAGATANDHQPWFAMEFIDGVDLKTYASRNHLPVRDKLLLIAQICDAVQHAHQQGVIHRDLKPGNVLVDQNHQTRILDFGVARLTDSDIHAVTIHTSVGQIVGTLTYMSPEQASGNPDEIDTRTDIYALGAVAYELLTGKVPFDVQGKGIAEASRILHEEKPVPPGSFIPLLRGDVERILEKAMAKEKEFRYASAADLAEDIRRHLKNEPIQARPPGTTYLMKKFARRHRGLVAGTVLAFLILAIGLVVVTLERNRAITAEKQVNKNLQLVKTERNRAVEAEKLAAERLIQMEESTRQMQLVNDFITNMLRSPDPQRKGKEVRVVEILDAAAMTSQDYIDDPAVFGAITTSLGSTYYGLGMYEEAAAQWRNSLHAFEQVPDRVATERLSVMNNLAGVLTQLNKTDEARSMLHKLIQERKELYGEDDTLTRNSLNTLAELEQKLGNVVKAVDIWEKLIEAHRRLHDPDHDQLVTILNNLGQIYSRNGRLDEARPLLAESVELGKKIKGEDHPDTLKTMSNLAQLQKRSGKLAEAESLHRHVATVRRKKLGEHPDLYTSLNNLAMVLQEDGRLEEAEPLMRESLEGFQKFMGQNHQLIMVASSNYANLLIDLDRPDEAEPILHNLVQNARKSLPDNHWMVAIFESNLGHCQTKLGKYKEAKSLLLPALECIEKKFGPDHPRTQKIRDRIRLLSTYSEREEGKK